MTDPVSNGDASKFFEFGHMKVAIDRGPDATMIAIEDTASGCNGACISEDEARALRDWLNKVLP